MGGKLPTPESALLSHPPPPFVLAERQRTPCILAERQLAAEQRCQNVTQEAAEQRCQDALQVPEAAQAKNDLNSYPHKQDNRKQF